MKQFINILTFLFILNANLFAQIPAKKIPEFNFYRLNNTIFTNKDLTTNKPILFVFFDVECEHCRHAIKFFSEQYNAFENSAIYLLTLDSKERLSAFLNIYGHNLVGKKNVTILQDSHQEFISRFGPRKYPSMFLYSKNRDLLLYDDEEAGLQVFLKKIKNLEKK